MACRLFGAKLLPELLMTYCQMYPWEQISVKIESKYLLRYVIHLKMVPGSHFVSVPDVYNTSQLVTLYICYSENTIISFVCCTTREQRTIPFKKQVHNRYVALRMHEINALLISYPYLSFK